MFSRCLWLCDPSCHSRPSGSFPHTCAELSPDFPGRPAPVPPHRPTSLAKPCLCGTVCQWQLQMVTVLLSTAASTRAAHLPPCPHPCPHPYPCPHPLPSLPPPGLLVEVLGGFQTAKGDGPTQPGHTSQASSPAPNCAAKPVSRGRVCARVAGRTDGAFTAQRAFCH